MHNEQKNGETEAHLSREEARAGSSTTVNRNVLMISVALAVIVMAIVIGSGFFTTDRTGADEVNANNGSVANVQSPPTN